MTATRCLYRIKTRTSSPHGRQLVHYPTYDFAPPTEQSDSIEKITPFPSVRLESCRTVRSSEWLIEKARHFPKQTV